MRSSCTCKGQGISAKQVSIFKELFGAPKSTRVHRHRSSLMLESSSSLQLEPAHSCLVEFKLGRTKPRNPLHFDTIEGGRARVTGCRITYNTPEYTTNNLRKP